MTNKQKTGLLVGSIALASALASGCMSHAVRVEPIAIQPVHVTMDVNLRIDREARGVATEATEPPASSTSGDESSVTREPRRAPPSSAQPQP